MPTAGILYVVYGGARSAEYRKRLFDELALSLESVKATMPDMPVALVTDPVMADMVTDQPIDHVLERELPDVGWSWTYKIDGLAETPFDHTIYLDTDTYLTDSITETLALLDHFDLAATLAVDLVTGYYPPECEIPLAFPELSTGVLVYRQSPAMQQLFVRWSELHAEHETRGKWIGFGSQNTLRMALYEAHDVRFAVMPHEYNCAANYAGMLNFEVKVVHEHDTSYLKTYARKLNSKQGMRVFLTASGIMFVVKRPQKNRILRAIRHRLENWFNIRI